MVMDMMKDTGWGGRGWECMLDNKGGNTRNTSNNIWRMTTHSSTCDAFQSSNPCSPTYAHPPASSYQLLLLHLASCKCPHGVARLLAHLEQRCLHLTGQCAPCQWNDLARFAVLGLAKQCKVIQIQHTPSLGDNGVHHGRLLEEPVLKQGCGRAQLHRGHGRLTSTESSILSKLANRLGGRAHHAA